MFRKWSIAWRLSVSVLLASVLILSAVIGYGYVIARQILEQELEAKAWQMARATTGRIELVEIAARKIVEGMDGRMEINAPPNQEILFTLLERLVRDNSEIYGATVALEPGAFGLCGWVAGGDAGFSGAPPHRVVFKPYGLVTTCLRPGGFYIDLGEAVLAVIAKSLGGVVADALTDHAAKAVPVIALVLVDAQPVVVHPAARSAIASHCTIVQ